MSLYVNHPQFQNVQSEPFYLLHTPRTPSHLSQPTHLLTKQRCGIPWSERDARAILSDVAPGGVPLAKHQFMTFLFGATAEARAGGRLVRCMGGSMGQGKEKQRMIVVDFVCVCFCLFDLGTLSFIFTMSLLCLLLVYNSLIFLSPALSHFVTHIVDNHHEHA